MIASQDANKDLLNIFPSDFPLVCEVSEEAADSTILLEDRLLLKIVRFLPNCHSKPTNPTESGGDSRSGFVVLLGMAPSSKIKPLEPFSPFH